jgi:large subunit ribosomal protein L21
MKAIIKTGGKQYIVSKDDVIKIEKIKNVNENDEITFDNVLLAFDKDNVKVGTPTVKDVAVKGIVTEIKKDKKVTIRKYKNKTRYRKTIGHRQIKAKVKITSIA